MKMGSGLDEAAKAGGGFDNDRVIQSSKFDFDVPYKFRCLEPIIPVQRVLYPCLVEDEKSKTGYRQSWRELRLPMAYEPLGWKAEPTVVEALEKVDLEIRESANLSGMDARSPFTPQKKWIIPVFDRRDASDKAPEIKFLEVGWALLKALRSVRDNRDEEDTNLLAFGPHWIWDVVMKKFKNDKKGVPDWARIEYSVTAAKNNPFAGKIPASVLETKNIAKLQELFGKTVSLGSLTEAEKAAIDLFDEDELVKRYAPMSNTDILGMFEKFPLCVDATSTGGGSVFPDKRAFAAQLMDVGMTHGLLSGGVVGEGKALPEPEPEPTDPEPKKPAKEEATKPAEAPKAKANLAFLEDLG